MPEQATQNNKAQKRAWRRSKHAGGRSVLPSTANSSPAAAAAKKDKGRINRNPARVRNGGQASRVGWRNSASAAVVNGTA